MSELITVHGNETNSKQMTNKNIHSVTSAEKYTHELQDKIQSNYNLK